MISKSNSLALHGSSLRGTITASYDTLVKTFGEPTPVIGEDKMQVIWEMQFPDGTLIAIYDWKYDGQPVETITCWNVGGFSRQALWSVWEALDGQQQVAA